MLWSAPGSLAGFVLRRVLRAVVTGFLIANLLVLLLAAIEVATPAGADHAWFQCEMQIADYARNSALPEYYWYFFNPPLCPNPSFPII